jgi:hypothetical protein
MQIILKTLWALLLVVISGTYAFGQDYTVAQDQMGANFVHSMYFDMVDATDGYTAETGLSPTCTILYPSKTSYVSCSDTVTEIGTGTYRVRLSSGAEWENLGIGSLYITSAGARPARIKYTVIENGSYFLPNSSLVKAPSDLNNTQQWTLSGGTVTSNTSADYRSFTIADTFTGDGATSQHRAIVSSIPNLGGSRAFYGSVEVKSGTINNAWVGDDNWGVGIDINTSTGVITPSTVGYLKGWRVEKLASSWWRVHWVYETPPSDASTIRMTLGLGNGTVSTAPPSFLTGGTMLFARAYLVPVQAVNPELIEKILPSVSAAGSATSVTLASNESGYFTQEYNNREICFYPADGYAVNALKLKMCSCIATYNQTTKVTTLAPALAFAPTNMKYKIGDLCLNNIVSVTGNVGGNVTGTVGSVVGAVGSVTATTNANVVSMASDTITNTAIANDALGVTEMSTASRNAIADTTLRRQTGNVEASAFGDTLDFRSVYGATAQQTHKNAVSAGLWTVYKDDNSTTLNTRAVTGTAGANPITGTD